MIGNLTLLVKPASAECDLACKYCFYSETVSHRASEIRGIMTKETACALIDKAFSTRPTAVTFVFQGGEPLVCGVEFYRFFVSAVRERNTEKISVNYSVQTNGCLLDSEFAKLFADEHFLVGISLDGTKDIHDSLRTDRMGNGSYDRAVKAINLLYEYGVSVNILTVLSAEVCAQPERVWESLSRYGYLQFIPYIPRGESDVHIPSDDALAKFFTYTFSRYAEAAITENPISVREFDGYAGKLLGKRPVSCISAGQCGGYLALEADGSVYPCDFYMDDAHLLGNILNDTVERLLSCQTMTDFLCESRRRGTECADCGFLKLCQCGCPALRNGGEYKYCNAYREFFSRSAPTLISLVKVLRAKSR